MQRIIKNGQVVDETWHLLAKDVTLDVIPNCCLLYTSRCV